MTNFHSILYSEDPAFLFYTAHAWHEITDIHVLKFSLFINRAKVKASAHSIMRVIRCVTSVLNNITYVQTYHKLFRFLTHSIN